MKKQIRRGVFETNSSSTHSLTMMMKSDYERWERENLYRFNGWTGGWEFNCPVEGYLYTRDEAVEWAKENKYYKDVREFDNEILKDVGFTSFDEKDDEYFENFYKEFTTPFGETIVAFGKYGYDG